MTGDVALAGRSPIRLSDVSIAELVDGLEAGRYSSVQLVEAYIARIHDVQPRVRSISEINPDALAEAREKDRERAAGEARGLLHGVPILVKDVFYTNDGMNTTAGFLGLLGSSLGFEATAAAKLRRSGAIILAKTSVSEWMNFRDGHGVPNGWSARAGQCRGIFHDNQDGGGSSTGSAVATALGLGAAALGTETSGSIASPAKCSGIVGLKPTSGLVSRHGVICASNWQDSVGVLAQNVLDAATVLTVIAGQDKNDLPSVPDPRDADQSLRPPKDGTDFRAFCQGSALQGMRIAVPRHVIEKKAFLSEAFEEALGVMRDLGATIVDDVIFPKLSWELCRELKGAWHLMKMIDFRNSLNQFLSSLQKNPNNIRSIEDVIKYTAETPEEEAGTYGMADLIEAKTLGDQFDKDPQIYNDSHALRQELGMEVGKLLDRYDCDVLVAPNWSETSASAGGNPHVCVPLPAYPPGWPVQSRSNGMASTGPGIPTSIMFVGRRWDDGRLLGAAYAFERATQHRKRFKPNVHSEVELDELNAQHLGEATCDMQTGSGRGI